MIYTHSTDDRNLNCCTK